MKMLASLDSFAPGAGVGDDKKPGVLAALMEWSESVAVGCAAPVTFASVCDAARAGGPPDNVLLANVPPVIEPLDAPIAWMELAASGVPAEPSALEFAGNGNPQAPVGCG